METTKPESWNTPSGPKPENKKVVAGVLGILLGGFGIHKFVLGYTQEGIIQIVVTLVTCGAGSLIGFIEGIIYLTKTDEEFYQTYQVGKKGWFKNNIKIPFVTIQMGFFLMINFKNISMESTQENKKVVAGILAILLGALGIHKFYLGYSKEGIIQLLLGLLCGIGGIIGLIEGIIYLTKSDEDFYQTYQVGKKGWL